MVLFLPLSLRYHKSHILHMPHPSSLRSAIVSSRAGGVFLPCLHLLRAEPCHVPAPCTTTHSEHGPINPEPHVASEPQCRVCCTPELLALMAPLATRVELPRPRQAPPAIPNPVHALVLPSQLFPPAPSFPFCQTKHHPAASTRLGWHGQGHSAEVSSSKKLHSESRHGMLGVIRH